MYRVLLLAGAWAAAGGRRECPERRSLELGGWSRELRHLDSTVVEHRPTPLGHVFIYENEFPGHVIRYVHVDNVAVRTCGARATLKAGGLGQRALLVVLSAAPGHELRSVIDVWGQRDTRLAAPRSARTDFKSTFLYKDVKAPPNRHPNPF